MDTKTRRPVSTCRWLATAAIVYGLAGWAQTPVGTAFTYQGQLREDGAVVNEACDFEFRLWTAEAAGDQTAATVTANSVPVTRGAFTVLLDFGAVFDGQALWLEVAVRRPAGDPGAFIVLV